MENNIDNCNYLEGCLALDNSIIQEEKDVELEMSDQYYTGDWFSHNINEWNNYKTLFYNRTNIHCLEVGSYEGRSAIYMAENYCNGEGSYVDALDTWVGSIEHNPTEKNNLFERFTHNTEKYTSINKINVYRDFSSNTLIKLVQEQHEGLREKYDVIYVDGSHIAKDVLMDSVLSWELLKIGGVMIFDDYSWDRYSDPALNPRITIDGFLDIYSGMYLLMHKTFQVHIIKAKNSLV
jgi:predicted O-methyltransferase YrrM